MALKRKIDKLKENEAELSLVTDMMAIIAKCEVLGYDHGYAFIYMIDKGYDVHYRLGASIGKNRLDPVSEVLYKNMVIGATRLTKPRLTIRYKKTNTKVNKFIELCRADTNYIPNPVSFAEHTLYYGIKEAIKWAVTTTDGYAQFRQFIRGYNAEGHPVHRLVARGNKVMTYNEAKQLLRTTAMSDGIQICGLTPQFTSCGALTTVF